MLGCGHVQQHNMSQTAAQHVPTGNYLRGMNTEGPEAEELMTWRRARNFGAAWLYDM